MFGMYQNGKRALVPSTSLFRSNLANYLIYYLFVKKEFNQTYLERINWFIIDPEGNRVINWRAVVISRLLEIFYYRLEDLAVHLLTHEKKIHHKFEVECNIRNTVLAKCRKIISDFLKRGAEVKREFSEDIKNIYNGQDSEILRYFLGENKEHPEYKNTFPATRECKEFEDNAKDFTGLDARGKQYDGGHERYNDNYDNNYDGGHERYDNNYNGGREKYDNYDERYDNNYSRNKMYGGELLEQLRIDIGRSKEDIELNKLKEEILILRNN
jgi:hypothetical protein